MNQPQPSGSRLGKQLRSDRLAAGLSIDDLQAASGIDRSTINRIETGQITAPNPLKLQQLAEAVGAKASDYFALAGYFSTKELPSLTPYLRARYDASPNEAAEIERYFAWIRERERSRINNDDQAAA